MPFYADYQIRVGGRISYVSSFDGAVERLHPKRKLYNTVYKKTMFSLFDLFK